jgi:hypothetical protein
MRRSHRIGASYATAARGLIRPVGLRVHPGVNTDDCDRLASLAPGLGLGALDADEAAFARAHVAACHRPHPEVRDAIALAAAIGSALSPPDRPSPGLRDRILAAARADAPSSR